MEVQEGPFTALIPDGIAPNAPVIAIMGWAGAQDRALRKYAEMVASWGLPSIRSVQPAALLFSPIALPRRRWAERLLAFAAAQGLSPPRPLILYAFSNGGAFIIEQIAQLAARGSPEHAHLRRSILGCVFDSAPAYLHPGLAEQVEAQVLGDSGEGGRSGLARAAKGAALRVMAAVGPLVTGNRAQQFW
jgi:hypothetical protein